MKFAPGRPGFAAVYEEDCKGKEADVGELVRRPAQGQLGREGV